MWFEAFVWICPGLVWVELGLDVDGGMGMEAREGEYQGGWGLGFGEEGVGPGFGLWGLEHSMN